MQRWVSPATREASLRVSTNSGGVMEDGRGSPSLHLDLSNFEDGVGSHYVLTSPRSLEACARLGVRPVELLPKSLEELREENPEVSLQRLSSLFVTQEAERHHKLEMCRELRMELLRGDYQPGRAYSRSPGGHKYCLPPTSLDKLDRAPLYSNRRDLLDTLKGVCRDRSPLLSPDQPTDRTVSQDLLTRDHRGGSGTLCDILSLEDHQTQKARRMARTVERELWASLPDRDKKIGALMLLKHQEEEMSKQRRQQAQQAWDNLKTEERYIRAILDRQDWPIQKQNPRRQSWSPQLERICMSSHKTLLQDQQVLLKYGLTKVMADLKRKDTYLDSISGHSLEERMIKAFKAKMVKDLQEKKNIQIKNEYEKLRHSKLKEKVDKEAKAEELIKRVSIQQKEQRSQALQEKLMEERTKGLYEKASREDELKLMANLRALRLEKEQKDHKKMLARLTDHKIQQARDTLERSILGKAEKARELNFVKESGHQALKKKVDQEKENQRKEIVHVIRMKDLKSDRIRKEKEALVEEGRRIARASFNFRDKIRQQTKSRTFDQMALQATLNASHLTT